MLWTVGVLSCVNDNNGKDSHSAKTVAFLESQVVVHTVNYKKPRTLFIITGLYIYSSLQEVLISWFVTCPRGIRLFILPLTVPREFLTPCTHIAQANPALLQS